MKTKKRKPKHDRRAVNFWLADEDLERLDRIVAARPDVESRSAMVRCLIREGANDGKTK